MPNSSAKKSKHSTEKGALSLNHTYVDSDRAAAEEEYAKKLLKISKMSLGSKECGTLKGSLEAAKAELAAMGTAHSEVAVGMRRELEDALVVFTSTLRERRKLV
jgi:hypothetical protein